MAFPTAEQERVAAALVSEYGRPDRAMLMQTDEPYGLMYIAWFQQFRILFIKPDGKRQLFEGAQSLKGLLTK